MQSREKTSLTFVGTRLEATFEDRKTSVVWTMILVHEAFLIVRKFLNEFSQRSLLLAEQMMASNAIPRTKLVTLAMWVALDQALETV